MTLLTIATTQMPCTWDLQLNLDQAEQRRMLKRHRHDRQSCHR